MERIIYMWTSPEGKSYIGQTKDEERRILAHRGCIGFCTHFYNAIKKFGWINFKYEVLHRCNMTQEQSDDLEEMEIENRKTLAPYGYNVLKGSAKKYYRPRSRKEKIINVTTGVVFESMIEAAKADGTFGPNVSRVVNGKLKSTNGYVYVRVGDYNKDIDYMNGIGMGRKKPVRCIETGETWKSVSECARSIDGVLRIISECCTGKRKTYRKLHWEFVQ